MRRKLFSFWAVLLAIILGAFIGGVFGKEILFFQIPLYSIFDIGGQLFIQALMLVVLPLIISSIISGIASFTKEYSFKELGLKILSIFISLNFLALLTAAILIYLFLPQIESSAQTIYKAAKHLLPTMKTTVQQSYPTNISNFILQLIPSNIIEAFYNSKIIGLIFFSLLFGYSIGQIEAKPAAVLRKFWQGVFQVMLKITMLILTLLPLGVFFLVAKQFALTGFRAFIPLSFFLFLVLISFILFAFIVLPLILKFYGKIKPFSHMKKMLPALIFAFSTSSSSATIPILIYCLEKKVGIPKRLANLIVPLGTTLNMAGSALYVFIAVVFISCAFEIPITINILISIFLYTFIITFGIASVPSASLFAIILVLQILNLPPESITLIIAADRLLDMFRTTTNVLTCSCSTTLIVRLEEKRISSSE